MRRGAFRQLYGSEGKLIRLWDGQVFLCDTCDNLLMWEQYDEDGRMCKACAQVVEEAHG